MPRRRGSAEFPFAVRNIFAFSHKCSLLCDVPAKTPKEGQVAAKRLMGKQKNPQGEQDCKCRAITSLA